MWRADMGGWRKEILVWQGARDGGRRRRSGISGADGECWAGARGGEPASCRGGHYEAAAGSGASWETARTGRAAAMATAARSAAGPVFVACLGMRLL